MICLKTEYYGENKELMEDLINTLNKTIHNFCVEHKEAFIIFNQVSIIGIPTKVIE